MRQSLHFAGRGSANDKLFCTSCRKRIFYRLQPAVIFFGLLLAEFGFIKFGRSLLKVYQHSLPVYIFLSVVIVGVFSIRLSKKRYNFNIMRRSLVHRLNLAVFSMLLPLFVIQIGIFYCNLIPAKDKLIAIEDKIIEISHHEDGLPDFIVLKEQGADKRYYIATHKQFMAEWQIAEKLKKNMKVKIIAGKSKNIFYPDDPYLIWEIATHTEAIIPYDAFRKARASYAKADNLGLAKITLLTLLCYILTRYLIKRKNAENN